MHLPSFTRQTIRHDCSAFAGVIVNRMLAVWPCPEGDILCPRAVYERLLIGEHGERVIAAMGHKQRAANAVCLPVPSYPVKIALNRQIVTLAQHGL